MGERYNRLFSQQQNLYSATSPVVIAAGALLKDNQSGKVLVQLKLRNIGAKEIKAAKVSVCPFDTAGTPLGAEVEHQYLDLTAKHDEEFGAKTALPLTDVSTRAFSVSVTEVIFADNSIWKATGALWGTLPRPEKLEDTLEDAELLRQYHMKYGATCRYEPTAHKDLWYCTCGALNRQGEVCHACERALPDLQRIDLAELRAERDARLAAEKAAAEEKARTEAAATEARAKKAKKTAKIVVPLLLIAAVIATVILTKPARAMKEAREIAEGGDYMSAVALLDEFDRPDKTATDRQEYTDAMESEIQAAISNREITTALALIEKYSVLETSEKNIHIVQSRCKHNLEETEYVVNTCTTDGHRLEVCTICGYEDKTIFRAPGHKYDSTVVKEPTCTDTGLSENVCNVCGEQGKDTVLEALGHDYKETVLASAKCEKEGQSKFACTRCGDSYTEAVAAKGHNFSKATCTKASTCSSCGKSNGSALGHTTTVGYCSRCNKNVTPTITFSGYYKDPSNLSFSEKLSNGDHDFGYKLPLGKYKITVETTMNDWFVLLPSASGGGGSGDWFKGSGNASSTFEITYDSPFRRYVGISQYSTSKTIGGNYTITISPIN